MTEHAFHGRREDQRMLTGKGRYTSDFNFPGQLYAAFVRADRASAKLLSVDAAAAREAPGVAAVYTGADLAAHPFGTLKSMVSYKGVGGEAIKVPARPVLARDCVRFVGEEIALVVATSVSAAQDAAELVMVDYEDLPAVAHPLSILNSTPWLTPSFLSKLECPRRAQSSRRLSARRASSALQTSPI